MDPHCLLKVKLSANIKVSTFYEISSGKKTHHDLLFHYFDLFQDHLATLEASGGPFIVVSEDENFSRISWKQQETTQLSHSNFTKKESSALT